jgi:hypothetical protein
LGKFRALGQCSVTSGIGNCVVKVLRSRSVAADIAGTGILVSKSHVLTCAHVVEAAVGLDEQTHLSKADALNIEVQMELGVLLRLHHARVGTVVDWYAILDGRDDGRPADIALLKLDEQTELRVPHDIWRQYEPHDRGCFYGFGSPDLWIECECMGQTTNLVQLNCFKHEARPGYSGSPVFDKARQKILGMVVASNPEKQVAKMVEARMLKQLVPAFPPTGDLAGEPHSCRATSAKEPNKEGAIEQLAKVFNDESSSRSLLDSIGFPDSRVPRFDRPIDFWRVVWRDLELGVIDGGISSLLNTALRRYPYSTVFKSWRVADSDSSR